MDHSSQTIDVLVDRMELTRCEYCGCEIDVSDLTLFDQIICPECNTQGSVPCKLGPYLMLDRIGSGAMGTVYRAQDEFLAREVAIKVLKKKLGENKVSIEKFKREAMAIAQLNHPNIAQVYAFGEQNEQPYIVMEYLPGDTLKDMMSKKKQLDQALVLKAGINIARALEAASEVRIVHGDVKPENITFDDKGQAKLVDFGIATFDYGSGEKGIFGTPYYIAPEKLTPGGTDTRADMYSLGATLFHALTGRPPFISTSNSPMECAKMRLHNDAPPLSRLRRSINPDVNKIVLRMLEREPGRRHPNYTSLIHDMQKTLRDLISNPQPEPAPTQRSQARRTTHPKKTVRVKQSSRPARVQSTPRTTRPRATARANARHAPPQKSSGAPVALFVILGIILLVVAIGVISQIQKKRKYRTLVTNYQYALADHVQTAAKHAIEINKLSKAVSSRLEQLKLKVSTDDPSLSFELQRTLDPNKKIIAAAQKRAEKIANNIERFSTQIANIQAAIPGSRNLQNAADSVEGLKSIIKTLKSFGSETETLISKVKDANSSNLKLIAKHKAVELAKAKEAEAKAKAEAIAKEKADRLAAAQLKNQQAKDKKLADLKARESKQIEETEKRIVALIKINEFDMAFETLIKLHCKTDEAVKARLALKSEITRLTQWKHWIALQLGAAPLKDGWTANGKKYNITNGNDTGFQITGGFVPWKNVPPRKLLSLFNYFIAKEQLDNTTKANFYFAAMTYCSETGIYQGVELYLDKAAEFDPSIRSNPEVIAMLTSAKDVLSLLPSQKQPPKKPTNTKKTVSGTTPVVDADFTRNAKPDNIRLGNDVNKEGNGIRTDRGKDLNMSLDIANGLYEIFFTITSTKRDLSITIEAEKTASGIGHMTLSARSTIGPFIIKVADKELNISLENKDDELVLYTMKIYRLPDSWSASQVRMANAMLSGKKLANGLRYKYYEVETSCLPDFSKLKHEEQGRADRILDKIPEKLKSNYAISQQGYIDIPLESRYSFRISADDGGKLYIDGKLIVANAYPQAHNKTTGTIALAKGKHRIETEYFQRTRKSSFDLEWKLPNSTKWAPVPQELLYYTAD